MFSCDYRNFLDFCVDLASMSLPVFQGRAKWMTPHPPPSLYSKVNRKTIRFRIETCPTAKRLCVDTTSVSPRVWTGPCDFLSFSDFQLHQIIRISEVISPCVLVFMYCGMYCNFNLSFS